MVCRINPNGQNPNGQNTKWWVGILSASSSSSSSSSLIFMGGGEFSTFFFNFPPNFSTRSQHFPNLFLQFFQLFSAFFNFFQLFPEFFPTFFQLFSILKWAILLFWTIFRSKQAVSIFLPYIMTNGGQSRWWPASSSTASSREGWCAAARRKTQSTCSSRGATGVLPRWHICPHWASCSPAASAHSGSLPVWHREHVGSHASAVRCHGHWPTNCPASESNWSSRRPRGPPELPASTSTGGVRNPPLEQPSH